ncbi:MAG: DUF429 domain-containing protein [Nitrospiraceae bacterium]|nr:DUF429 domain-containing protein [Nitrospiraceae bacterium]
MKSIDAWAGIDVAFAKRKRLPVSVCVWEGNRLIPRPVADRSAPIPPRGEGNAVALDREAVERFADETADYLRELERYFKVSIRRVAIDAPSDPKSNTLKRRKAEEALDARGIHCFTTPSADEFAAIREKAQTHLRNGGAESRLPHANQLWMLVGFALFERLRRDWECLEMFPQATVFVLGASATHKSKPGGVAAQLKAIAGVTGWPDPPNELLLKAAVHGPVHDGLDAYASAWIAALGVQQRIGLGMFPTDVIWVPRMGPAA